MLTPPLRSENALDLSPYRTASAWVAKVAGLDVIDLRLQAAEELDSQLLDSGELCVSVLCFVFSYSHLAAKFTGEIMHLTRGSRE